MKRMIIVFLVITLFGCSLTNTPATSVERYLDNYKKVSEDVLRDLEKKVNSEDLSNMDRERYKNVLIKQYQDLKYEIKDESIDKDKAEVLVNINVYDLYNVEEKSNDYLNEHIDEFSNVNKEFDKDLFNRYRINKMLETNNRVDYQILFKLNKVDGNWIVKALNRVDLEKIHGLYNSENN